MVKDNEFIDIEDFLPSVRDAGDSDTFNPADYSLLIDRLVISTEADEISRLNDSIEAAFFEGRDSLKTLFMD